MPSTRDDLLTNARKYTRDFVRLSCHVMPDDNSFAIEVEDNGVGIDPNDHERIFNAFGGNECWSRCIYRKTILDELS